MWKDSFHAGVEGCEEWREGVLCNQSCTYDTYTWCYQVDHWSWVIFLFLFQKQLPELNIFLVNVENLFAIFFYLELYRQDLSSLKFFCSYLF